MDWRKNHEHPEFFIYFLVKQLKEENPGIKGIDHVLAEIRKIINENSISITQNAHLHVMLEDDLDPETQEMLLGMYEAVIGKLRRGIRPSVRPEDETASPRPPR